MVIIHHNTHACMLICARLDDATQHHPDILFARQQLHTSDTAQSDTPHTSDMSHRTGGDPTHRQETQPTERRPDPQRQETYDLPQQSC